MLAFAGKMLRKFDRLVGTYMHDYSSSLLDLDIRVVGVFWAQHNFQSQENVKTAKTPQILKLSIYPTKTEQVVWVSVSHAFCSFSVKHSHQGPPRIQSIISKI